MKEETLHWLEMAEADKRAAGVLLREGLFALVVFHCQQAVEKLLKALWVECIGGIPPRTHNLLDLASELRLPLTRWEPFLGALTDQAVASRYVGAQAYTQATAHEYMERTVELCEQLRQLLR